MVRRVEIGPRYFGGPFEAADPTTALLFWSCRRTLAVSKGRVTASAHDAAKAEETIVYGGRRGREGAGEKGLDGGSGG